MNCGPGAKKMRAGGKVRKYAEGGKVEIEIKMNGKRKRMRGAEVEMNDDDDMDEMDDMPVRKMKEGGMTSKKFIQGAIKKPGALRAQMGVKAGETIPAKKLAAAAKAPGKLGQRARFAQTLARMRKK